MISWRSILVNIFDKNFMKNRVHNFQLSIFRTSESLKSKTNAHHSRSKFSHHRTYIHQGMVCIPLFYSDRNHINSQSIKDYLNESNSFYSSRFSKHKYDIHCYRSKKMMLHKSHMCLHCICCSFDLWVWNKKNHSCLFNILFHKLYIY